MIRAVDKLIAYENFRRGTVWGGGREGASICDSIRGNSISADKDGS